MKITIDFENGQPAEVIENVMDYAVFGKDDLIRDFNEIMEGQITWDDLSVAEQDEMYQTVKKNISYFDSLCSSEDFYGEVRGAITEVGIDQRKDVNGFN